MNINECFQYVNYLANKEQSGNVCSPEQFNLLLPQCLIDYCRREIGLEESYQPNGYNQISWEKYQILSDNIRQLKVISTLSVSASGVMTVPVDYFYVTSIRYIHSFLDKCGDTKTCETSVEIVNDNEWGDRLCSQVKIPSKKYPIAKFDSGQLQFAPKNLGSVIFSYLRKPIKPFWNSTFNTTLQVPEFNAAGSIDIELPEQTHTMICHILLGRIGINLSEERLYQYAEQFKTKGV